MQNHKMEAKDHEHPRMRPGKPAYAGPDIVNIVQKAQQGEEEGHPQHQGDLDFPVGVRWSSSPKVNSPRATLTNAEATMASPPTLGIG